MSFDFTRSVVDHLVFIKKNTNDCVLLTVYVDDIILTVSDTTAIRKLNNIYNNISLLKI